MTIKRVKILFPELLKKACYILPMLLIHSSFIGFSDNNDEEISTDTVTIASVQLHISDSDTGAFAEKFKFKMSEVTMSHIEHENAGVTECITCHHKHDNDDRIKECAQCHKGVEGMEIMHENCGTCHKEEMISVDCRSCHKGEKRPRFFFGLPSSEAQLHNVIFSHVSHYPRDEDCKRCHTTVDNSKQFQKSSNYPPMAECLTCHDNKKAPENCALCHGDADTLKPQSHANNWLHRNGHGMEANFNQASCLLCHKEISCNDCHLGQTSFKIHPPGYRVSHGMDVKTKRSNCVMCHETRSMCARCHELR